MYVSIKEQPQKLGSLEVQPRLGNFGDAPIRKPKKVIRKSSLGDFGQGGDTATGVITALGNAINGIVTAITNSQVLRTDINARKSVANTASIENTKKLQILTEGQVQEAQIAVSQTEKTYSGITKVILGGGVVLAGILIAAAYSYSVASGARGEYEIEYQTS